MRTIKLRYINSLWRPLLCKLGFHQWHTEMWWEEEKFRFQIGCAYCPTIRNKNE